MSTPTDDLAAPWAGDAPVDVNVHLYERTALFYRLHPDESRVVLHIAGANRAGVAVFAQRDDLARLVATATAALAELDGPAVTDSAA